ncbi:MAG: DsbA family oxidoreductase [Ectothiorhodospiraceae bacterium]|nr:DsbA family oxidoreductase [Chromatiales bacterium]MCP5154494.1 DsbA family oxidoreductase [Ectothiorhodospiraceae bacterium]
MQQPIAIDIFSDVICPWCRIGWERLKVALSAPGAPVAAIRWLPFELNPDMPREGMDRSAYLSAKFGGPQGAARVYERVREAARGDGVEFAFERIERTPSTFDAHRLVWLGQCHGLGIQVKEALFDRYFSRGDDIGERAVLLDVAVVAGLDRAESEAMLDGTRGAEEVRGFEQAAQRLGITGVPFFVVDRRLGVSGAQPPEVLAEVLVRARSEAVGGTGQGDPAS